MHRFLIFFFFFFNDTAPTEFSPLSLHDALPICSVASSSAAATGSVSPASAEEARVKSAPSSRADSCRSPACSPMRSSRATSSGTAGGTRNSRSEEHTSELHHSQISYAVFCLKKKSSLLLEHPLVINLHPRLGLLLVHARLQPHQHCQKPISPVVLPLANRCHLALHGHGHKNVRRLSHLDAAESCLRNADDGHFGVVHENRLIQRSGIPAEMPRPIGMAQHKYRMGALGIVIGKRKHS